MWIRKKIYEQISSASLSCVVSLCAFFAPIQSAELLVEAESFDTLGGWAVDQQFIPEMGSPYLIAHGLGTPVADAGTEIIFPETGAYTVWVRTKEWTAYSPAPAGVFRIAINGSKLSPIFGTQDTLWHWHNGGTVTIEDTRVRLALIDSLGFDGRCDALFFTTDAQFQPPSSRPELDEWRNQLLGVSESPEQTETYDLVVVGGGLAGCGAALSAARSGLSVALIQDRPVLGGNASIEVRVGPQGTLLGQGVDLARLISADNRLEVLSAEPTISLFLNWRAYDAKTQGFSITHVDARHIRTSEVKRFKAPLFVDCTGDGWIGYWAGAEFMWGREARTDYNESLAPSQADSLLLETSIMWTSIRKNNTTWFPETPWAQEVSGSVKLTKGDWNFGYGSWPILNTIYDAEHIRDHLLKAAFGTFRNAWKNDKRRALSYVCYMAGKRESRRFYGDYVLTQHKNAGQPEFYDGVARSDWYYDLHDWPTSPPDFLYSKGPRKDELVWIPFRTLYSKDIENLMMAGRCFSATHVGFSGPRVMNICAQMGVAVGKAAHLCLKHEVSPRSIAESRIRELQDTLLIDYSTFPEPPATGIRGSHPYQPVEYRRITPTNEEGLKTFTITGRRWDSRVTGDRNRANRVRILVYPCGKVRKSCNLD